MSQINIKNLSNENEDGAPDIVGISTLSATSYFVPPVGNTAQRPQNPQGGDLRFNTDTASLEYFRGNTLGWSQIEMTSPNIGVSTAASTESIIGTGARGVSFSGHQAAAPVGNNDTIEYITIATLGNSADFGNATGGAKSTGAGVADRTRGIAMHSYPATRQYITFTSTGDTTTFGNHNVDTWEGAGVSNSTRGVSLGGKAPATTGTTACEYVTIQALGNGVDFGDLTVQRSELCGGVNSSTRGVVAGGRNPTNKNEIDYIEIATTGNSIDFGDLSQGWRYAGGVCNSTRGVWGGGNRGNAPGTGTGTDHMEYITIATTGTITTFGSLPTTNNKDATVGGVSSPTRGVFMGGYIQNEMNYITIPTLGDGKDFGDLLTTKSAFAGVSNAHGGL